MGHKHILRFTTEVDVKYFTLILDNIKVDGATGMPLVTEAQVNTLDGPYNLKKRILHRLRRNNSQEGCQGCIHYFTGIQYSIIFIAPTDIDGGAVVVTCNIVLS